MGVCGTHRHVPDSVTAFAAYVLMWFHQAGRHQQRLSNAPGFADAMFQISTPCWRRAGAFGGRDR